jgi:hypothetical protein
MPDRSKVMTQTKWDTLVLQVGGWSESDNPTSLKVCLLIKLQNWKTDGNNEDDSAYKGEEHLKNVGVGNCRRESQDRGQCRRILEEAEVHQGL